MNGRKFPKRFPLSAKMANLKKVVQALTGIKQDQQKLMLGEHELNLESLDFLVDLGFTEGTTIFVFQKWFYVIL